MPVMNDYEATAAIRSLPGAWDKQTGNRGCASEKLYQFCDTMAASEYRSLNPSISGYLYTFSKIEGGRMHFHRIPYV